MSIFQELIHAVLCEDAELAKSVLLENKDISVNIRFRVCCRLQIFVITKIFIVHPRFINLHVYQ